MKIIKKAREIAGLAYYSGNEMGATKFVSKFDTYRRYSSFLWLALGLFFMIVDSIALALICFGITHLHLLFNQLWWKILNLEYNAIEDKEID